MWRGCVWTEANFLWQWIQANCSLAQALLLAPDTAGQKHRQILAGKPHCWFAVLHIYLFLATNKKQAKLAVLHFTKLVMLLAESNCTYVVLTMLSPLLPLETLG